MTVQSTGKPSGHNAEEPGGDGPDHMLLACNDLKMHGGPLRCVRRRAGGRRRTGAGVSWMAGPAAVPGVDPSRVNTPGELAACLNGLRHRRDLAYEKMESAAVELRSRPGGSRLEPLPKSAVGEIVTGKRLPTKGKL